MADKRSQLQLQQPQRASIPIGIFFSHVLQLENMKITSLMGGLYHIVLWISLIFKCFKQPWSNNQSMPVTHQFLTWIIHVFLTMVLNSSTHAGLHHYWRYCHHDGRRHCCRRWRQLYRYPSRRGRRCHHHHRQCHCCWQRHRHRRQHHRWHNRRCCLLWQSLSLSAIKMLPSKVSGHAGLIQ